MKKLLVIFLSIILAFSFCACNTAKENTDTSTTVSEEPDDYLNASTAVVDTFETKNTEFTVNYGEKITVEGVLSKNETSFPEYCLKLNDSVSITLENEKFVCTTLYFYDDTEANGNYDFEKLNNSNCVVTASLENYRGGRELFLLEPTIIVDGEEAETQSSLNDKSYIESAEYSTAPILAKGHYIIPDSFDIYGRVSLDEISYGYYEGNTPKDPYRLSIVLTSTENNWYFIQKVYMDTLIFDKQGEVIKKYHTEYICHKMEENLDLLETWGMDNLNPQNQRYQIKENWNDFPENAYSAAVLLSFDVFAKTDFSIHTPDNSINVSPYEIRYVEPQAFDAFVDVVEGKLFENY